MRRGTVALSCFSPVPAPGCWQRSLATGWLAAKNLSGVFQVQHCQIQAFLGCAVAGFAQLRGDGLNGESGKILDGADAGVSRKNDDERVLPVNLTNENAMVNTLLVNGGKTGLVQNLGDGLSGAKGIRGQRSQVNGVKLAGVALLKDNETALGRNQSGRGVALDQEILQRRTDLLNVFLEQLRQARHTRPVCGRLR